MQSSSPDKNFKHEKTLNSWAIALKAHDSLLNAFNLPSMVTSTDGKIIAFNAAAERLLGYSAEEVMGKVPAMIFHDTEEIIERAEAKSLESEAEVRAACDVLISAALEAKTDPVEWTYIRKDGSRFPASLSVVALHDETNTVTGYAGIITDLTEVKALRQRMTDSEKRFTLLAENVPGAIYLCHNDASYSVIYVNDQIEDITGYPASDFINGSRTLAGLFHPDDRDRIYDTVNRAVAARKSFHLSYRMRHTSGEWRWIAEDGVGVYENGQLTMLEGFLQDITLQKTSEEELHRVAVENLRFFNNPVNLNAIADMNGKLQRVSPSWNRMLGWTEEELKSRQMLDFVHPTDVDRTRETLNSVSRSRRVQTLENRLEQKDGGYRWLLWALAADPGARLIYGSAIDISERKASEENILDSKSSLESLTLQLQEQNRRLDEFAHIISHNLRSPVNNIQALINLLDDKSEIQDYKLIYEKLRNVAKNISETMKELMDTLKARTQSAIDKSEIRFKEVLDKVVQSLEGELIIAEASVTFDFNEAPSVHFSKPYLESIFQNLLTNAIKYKSPNRKPAIHFKSAFRDNEVELQVNDNGQGIDMEKFGDKLFGLHKTFHEHEEARGVGLFLVKTQIEALGGTITANSEVDKGTVFTIRFGVK